MTRNGKATDARPATGAATQPTLLRTAQDAAIAVAEAIAAAEAARVAAEAAATARIAVDTAARAAVKAATRARDVAGQAVMAAAAAADEFAAAQGAGHDLPVGSESSQELAVGAEARAANAAAEKVAGSVAAVAAAAATAVVDAAMFVGEQLARDVAATATAVSAATRLHDVPEACADEDMPATFDDAGDGAKVSTAVPALAPLPSGNVESQRLADQLQAGIGAGQLRLHFQPIIALATGRASSVEALVRWQHPDRGLLAPDEFIALAEHTGLVIPLGEWVLHEACRLAVRLQTLVSAPPTVSINLSTRQLSGGWIVDAVRDSLKATGCGAERLVFEVTETGLVTDMAVAVTSLRALRDLGASVAIDDFGTGHATLQYLSQLPANVLKIDRSFISAMGGSSHDIAIVASLITLAHNVNVQCVAEGIETDAQLEMLQQLGCDFGQGYLISRPLDEATLDVWLNGHVVKSRRQAAALVPRNPETARILAMCAHGTSFLSIAAALNIEGSRTGDGRRWSASSVGQIVARAQRGGVAHAI